MTTPEAKVRVGTLMESIASCHNLHYPRIHLYLLSLAVTKRRDLPVTTDRLLAIICSRVEWLVSPSTTLFSDNSENPKSELQLPLIIATGRVREGL